MPRVFVIQNQHRMDRATSRLVPRFDFSAAAPYGDIEFLLSPTAAPWNPESIISSLKDELCEFSDGDSLLLVGNPVIIGWAVAIAAEYNDGVVQCLQWSGKHNKYVSIKADLRKGDDYVR